MGKLICDVCGNFIDECECEEEADLGDDEEFMLDFNDSEDDDYLADVDEEVDE